MERQQWDVQIEEVVFRDLVPEEDIPKTTTVGDESGKADAVLLAIGFHGIFGTAVIDELVTDFAVQIHVVQSVFERFHGFGGFGGLAVDDEVDYM